MTTGIPFCSMDYQSFAEPLQKIVSDCKDKRQIFIVGSSLGGNALANILAEPAFDTGDINASVLINPALNLEEVMLNLNKSLKGFYAKRFCLNFKSNMHWSNSYEILKTEYNKTGHNFDKFWNDAKTIYDLEAGMIKAHLGQDHAKA